MEGGVLTLRGERKFDDENDGRNFHRVERSYGQFVRSFTLPNNVDRENIKASFSDGLLEVALPKREEAKPRQIKIARPMPRRRRWTSRPADRVSLPCFTSPAPAGLFLYRLPRSPLPLPARERVGVRGVPKLHHAFGMASLAIGFSVA